MSNVSKVVLSNGEVLIDLTRDTVSPDKLGKGVTAHDAEGNEIVGTVPIDELVNAEDYLASVCNKEITELVNHKMVNLPGGDFQKGNNKLVKVDLPLVTFVRAGTFNQCGNLSIVNLPSVTKTDASCFESCQSLKKLYLPSLQTIEGWGWTFNNCQYLERVYFPVFTGTITYGSFGGNKRLATLILGSDTVVSLQSTGAFDNTPIKSGTGYIYVKRALVDSYKSETNWSTFANQFRAKEDYPEVLEGWE